MRRLIFLIPFVFCVLLGLSGLAYGYVCRYWTSDNSIVAGIPSLGNYHNPGPIFEFPGFENLTFIAGTGGGGFSGFYWNGTQWVQDSSRVAGLPDIGNRADPTVGFNVTGDGNWTLIAGNQDGNFYGFYWNGTQWVQDSSRVAGISSVSSDASPTLGFNVTGDGNWILIVGEYAGIFTGYYWNGTQWVNDTSIVAGLQSKGATSDPTLAFNVTGDGNWILIAGNWAGDFHGYYWNGTQWVNDTSIVAGLGEWRAYSSCSLGFNVTGDGNWILIRSSDATLPLGYYGFISYESYSAGDVYINSTYLGLGEVIEIRANITPLCPVDYADLLTNETGTYLANTGGASRNNTDIPTTGGNVTFTWSNSSIFNKAVGVKVQFTDIEGCKINTSAAIFYAMPYLAYSSNASIINTIYQLVDENNFTLKASAAGQVTLHLNASYICEDGTCECNYEASNAEKIYQYNRTDRCDIVVVTQDLSAGDIVRLQKSIPLRVLPPPNLPAALTAALVGTIIVIYTVSIKRKSEGWA